MPFYYFGDVTLRHGPLSDERIKRLQRPKLRPFPTFVSRTRTLRTLAVLENIVLENIYVTFQSVF